VQYVIRPDLDFRGFSGQLASGTIRVGQEVTVLPSGRRSRVKAIPSFDGDLSEAFAPMSINVTLEDEVDISRGDMLVDAAHMPHVSRRFDAHLVWMSDQPLATDRPYLLKHTTQQVAATINALRHRVDVNDLGQQPAETLFLNEIGVATIETTKPLFFDPYQKNRATGGFILIDAVSNATVAAGMIVERRSEETRKDLAAVLAGAEFATGRLTPGERYARWRHQPATVWLTARRDLAYLLERRLFDRGCLVHAIVDEFESHMLPELARFSNSAGMIAVCSPATLELADRDRARDLVGADRFIEADAVDLPGDDNEAAQKVLQLLENRGIIPTDRFASGEGI
jgi:hypothetical protein